jgi:hypothetical protein
MAEEKEKVICPTCKQLGYKSQVYVIDWQSSLQQIDGYYNENGDYVKSYLDPKITAIKAFWCTYGHFWIQTK